MIDFASGNLLWMSHPGLKLLKKNSSNRTSGNKIIE